jgi:hypothetical protein
MFYALAMLLRSGAAPSATSATSFETANFLLSDSVKSS